MRTDEDGGDAEPKDRRRDNGRPDTNMGLKIGEVVIMMVEGTKMDR